jgi:hypothetical protein
MVSGSVKRMAVGEGSCGRVCDRLEAVGKEKKDGQREETAAGFWFQREKEKEGAQFFFKEKGRAAAWPKKRGKWELLETMGG